MLNKVIAAGLGIIFCIAGIALAGANVAVNNIPLGIAAFVFGLVLISSYFWGGGNGGYSDGDPKTPKDYPVNTDWQKVEAVAA